MPLKTGDEAATGVALGRASEAEAVSEEVARRGVEVVVTGVGGTAQLGQSLEDGDA